MALTERQEFRRRLLLEAVSSLDDPKAALALAQEMERFVIEGIAEPQARHRSNAPREDAKPAGVSGKKPRWTKSDEHQLRELWVSGQPIPEIARHLGRSEISVGSRARHLSLPSRSIGHRTNGTPPKPAEVSFGGPDQPVQINHRIPNGQWPLNGPVQGEDPER